MNGIQTVELLVADEATKDRIGPIGGPVMPAGIIALRVAPSAVDGLGNQIPLNMANDDGDDGTVLGQALATVARVQIWNGVDGYDRALGMSAEAQALVAGRRGVAIAGKPGEWSEIGNPAVATLATCTRAAGGVGVRHVVTGISACLAAAAAAAGPVKVTLTDGVTVRWVGALAAPVQGVAVIAIDGLAIVCNANSAVTLAFAAAGAAGSQETVTLTGYSLNPG
jgi:hypothetical protein